MAKHEMPEPESQRKFREALERKNEKSKSGTAHQDGGGGQSRAQGPIESRRTFRRKSG